MKKTLIFFSILCITKVFGQPLNFQECTADEFFVVVEQKPEWKDSSDTFKSYFIHFFQGNKSVDGLSGKFLVGILISETGQACCRVFSDINKTGVEPALFKEAINKMPPWKPAKMGTRHVAYLQQTIIEFKKGEIIKCTSM